MGFVNIIVLNQNRILVEQDFVEYPQNIARTEVQIVKVAKVISFHIITRYITNKNFTTTFIYLCFIFHVFLLGYHGSNIACTKSVIQASNKGTLVVGCKARPDVFKLYYCKITVLLTNDKKVECVMYTNKNEGLQFTPLEGYCDKQLVTKYAKQIGNGAKGGCGFEIQTSKTNIGNIYSNWGFCKLLSII